MHAKKLEPDQKKDYFYSTFKLLVVIFLLVLGILPASYSQTSQIVRLEIIGLDSTLEQQVLAHVEANPEIELENIPNFVEQLKSKTSKSLQAVGYYHSEISAKHASYKTSTTIALQVNAGAPTLLGTVEFNLSSNDKDHNLIDQELRNLGLVKGQTFNHGTYEQAKAKIIKTALSLGYFDADFTRSQVLITKKDNRADVFIDYDLGTRYSIKEVVYKQDLYSENFLPRWQNFEAGVPYRASYVSDLTTNLQNSGYFKTVRVTPDVKAAVNYQLPLIVDLESAKENSVGVGIGFATDTRIRLKANWLRPHTNKHGHTLETEGSYSELRKDLSASYRVPQKKNPANNTYSLDIGFLNQTTDDTYSQLRTLEFAEHRLTTNKWRRNIFLRIENQRFDVGERRGKINLLLPGIGFSRAESTGGVHPTKGRLFSFQIMAARQSFFSDIDMLRATANAKFLTSWNRKHYLIARAELGALHSNSFINVPTTHRFFAGGDNSVRGYDYQQLSPRNQDNESIGGQYLSTASIEYNRYFTEKFAIATFIDSGRAFNDSSEPTQIGVGLGLRWRSPVGPLRIDLAHGLQNPASSYRLHLAIGPEL